MRAILTAAILTGAVMSAPAPALAEPAASVTVKFEFNFRPGHRTVTGADGTATLPVERNGVYNVTVAEPLSYEVVLHASAGGSDAQISIPAGTDPGTRQIGFRLAEGQDITVRVERTGNGEE